MKMTKVVSTGKSYQSMLLLSELSGDDEDKDEDDDEEATPSSVAAAATTSKSTSKRGAGTTNSSSSPDLRLRCMIKLKSLQDILGNDCRQGGTTIQKCS